MDDRVGMQDWSDPGPSHYQGRILRNLKRNDSWKIQGAYEEEANRILEIMQLDNTLMADSPDSEQRRNLEIRDLPHSLTMKRCVKTKVAKSVSLNSRHKPIGYFKRLKYRISLAFQRFNASLRNFNYFELWHSSLKYIEGQFGSGYASYFKFLRWLFVLNCCIALVAFGFVSIPQILHDFSSNSSSGVSFQFENIFLGGGNFRETILYYGHYTHGYVNGVYDMPAAYFSTILVLYLLSFVVLSASVMRCYSRSFIESASGFKNVYSNKVLCGWDFRIATREAANLKTSAIYNELKELLSEDLREKDQRTVCGKFCELLTLLVVNTCILTVFGAVGWGLWALLQEFSNQSDNSIAVTTVTVNAAMILLPPILSFISSLEGYRSPRTALYVTLTRTFLLGAVMIGIIMTFWLSRAFKGSHDCWETSLGEEIYRLIIFDFILSIIVTFIEGLYFLVQVCRDKNRKTEFNVARHTLELIYNQSLLWVGFLYSPLLPAIMAIKMLIVWYIKNACVTKLCKPPAKTWRASQAQTWFLVMTFFSILLAVAAHGYSITSIQASKTCGPFNNYSYIYEFVSKNVWQLEEDHYAWKVVLYITKPGVVALILIALSILVYYLRERAFAMKKKVEMLREMLMWVAADKEFLSKCYKQASGGDGKFQYNLRSNRFIDPTQALPSNNNWRNSERSERARSISGGSSNDDLLSSRFEQFS